MGRISSLKWDKSVEIRPNNNIISSDFSKYNPQPWKFMDGKARMEWLLSYEYQRKWAEERDAWRKRMFPDNLVVGVDLVKRYVLTFKANYQPPKPEQKKLFQMKKFQKVKASINNRRSSDDKAMAYLKEMNKQDKKKNPSPTNKTEQKTEQQKEA